MSRSGASAASSGHAAPDALAVADEVLAAMDAVHLDDDALVDAVRSLEALGRRVDAARAVVAAEAAERSRRELGPAGLAHRLGCRTHVELLQRLTGAAAVTVNRRVRVGRAVRPVHRLDGQAGPATFDHLATALGAGLLGTDAAAAVVDTLRPAARSAGWALVEVAERELVTGAAAPVPAAPPAHDADSVRLQARVWAAVLDPDGAEPTEADLQRRGLHLLPARHGLVPVRGDLLPEVAAALRSYADACTSPRTRDLLGPENGRGSAGDPTAVVDDAPPEGTETNGMSADGQPSPEPGTPAVLDTRSRAQQLHDVLATIVGAAARSADAPSLAGNPPTLVVTVRAEDLATGTGPAFTDAGVPLSSGAARHVGCAGAVQTVLTEAGGRIAGIGSPQRIFTPSQRRAIAVRDGGCVIPGCHVPPGWCETHHVTPYTDDPAGTHTDNGVLLCWYHHRTIDTSGWHIRMRDGLPHLRAPRWIDPDRAWRPAGGSALHASARLRPMPLRT